MGIELSPNKHGLNQFLNHSQPNMNTQVNYHCVANHSPVPPADAAVPTVSPAARRLSAAGLPASSGATYRGDLGTDMRQIGYAGILIGICIYIIIEIIICVCIYIYMYIHIMGIKRNIHGQWDLSGMEDQWFI